MKKSTNLVIKSVLFAGILFLSLNGCKNNKEPKKEQASAAMETNNDSFFKLSLAQWSLHKAILDDKTHDPIDFAEKAKALGFEGLEYVSGLYTEHIEKMGMDALMKELKSKSETHSIKNLLIMIDGEGNLASPDEKERNVAVENHKKWVDAAQFLGCHSIRVNLFGTRNADEWIPASKDGLLKLSTYAATKGVNIIVENHGYLSSNAKLLMDVINNVGMQNCGTLPDFGNFCLKREGGEQWGAKCIEEYDIYKGIEELMPAAKGVSAKSYDFDENGNETKIDYKRMLQIVKKSDFKGFIGVEYEGDRLSEEEGIIATRNLLTKLAKELN